MIILFLINFVKFQKCFLLTFQIAKFWFPEFVSSYAWHVTEITVNAPNIAHLSLLTSVGYNKKETNLKNSAQPNKVIIILMYIITEFKMKKNISQSLATLI